MVIAKTFFARLLTDPSFTTPLLYIRGTMLFSLRFRALYHLLHHWDLHSFLVPFILLSFYCLDTLRGYPSIEQDIFMSFWRIYPMRVVKMFVLGDSRP
ncbi:uncharacterized protein BT62DRAFT_472202 [Guyanagaster necrorhizus]|uniref:Uncharacterized protein n=1 Tax=Guyanagaster necrorhizus TaxID=856835 RepID=A0A9P7VKT2_9AGAR|nr:uncharacterized protein BT62DRAFT_472202 [Guyanagaster necrorhizus MCA 3950]KAG7441734.1 hypothetical protein BT62DRAFT_472202 [Guyanagaster necrorhizus MCA 3950]